jgi:hypothetical protein
MLVSSSSIPSSTPRYRHIVHPRPVYWLDIWKTFAARLEKIYSKPLRLVPYDIWRDALREATVASSESGGGMEAAAKTNPAIKLFASTFEIFGCARFEELAAGRGAETIDLIGIRRLATHLSVRESRVLSHTSKLGTGAVEAWIQGWVREGFLHSSGPLQ